MVDQGYTTFGYMMMQMVVAHGGRCAERIVFGDDISDGGSDDLEKITKVIKIPFQYIYLLPQAIVKYYKYKILVLWSYKFLVLIIFLIGEICFQIAREMVISPQNKKLGLIGLTKRVGLIDRPDNPDGELIRYRV